MENIFLITVPSDSNPKYLESEMRSRYTPEIEICYVCISKRFNLLQRAGIVRRIRKVFLKTEMTVKPVSDKSIHLLHTFIEWYQGLAEEVASSLNIFGKVLYRLWQRWRSERSENEA